ncbi:MAG: hypothetical protein IKR48_07510 [Kiritimatiellae bacterium]|nr:hypothetical protein [Kiritimatiellia bacterium]
MKRIWTSMVWALVAAVATAETCIVSGSTARTAAASSTAAVSAPVEAATAAVSAPTASASALDTRTATEDESAWITLDTRKPFGTILMLK